jgi:hypothetical protein
MQRFFKILLGASFVVVFFGSNLKAQTDIPVYGSSENDSTQTPGIESQKMNMIKINLLALPLKTFTLQYERVIKKYLSVAIAVRYMPNGSVPYKNWIYNRFGDDDPDFKETLDNMRISNYAITPEVRFYVGKKGYGSGFYISPSFRYAHFNLDNIEYSYVDDMDEESYINMSGKMNAYYGGFLLGAQWLLGEHLSLDWWIFAPFIGGEKTNLSGTTSVPLSIEDQQSLREELEDIDIPYTNTEVNVNENGASIKLNGLMAGISAGLAFGVRF